MHRKEALELLGFGAAVKEFTFPPLEEAQKRSLAIQQVNTFGTERKIKVCEFTSLPLNKLEN